MRLPRITLRATILFGDPPQQPKMFAPSWQPQGDVPMAAASLFVPISPVNPSDNVTKRTVTQTDSTGAVKTFLYDANINMHTDDAADDTLAPYTFSTVDSNASGDSPASVPVTLGPPTPPPPPPPPGVPAQPTMGTPQWGTPPSASVVDRRGK